MFFFGGGIEAQCGITFVFYGHLPVGESTRLLHFHARLGFGAWNHSQWTEASCLNMAKMVILTWVCYDLKPSKQEIFDP